MKTPEFFFPQKLGDAGLFSADGEIFSGVFVYLRIIPPPLYENRIFLKYILFRVVLLRDIEN